MTNREKIIMAFALRFLESNYDLEVEEMLNEALVRAGEEPTQDSELSILADDFESSSLGQ